MDYLVYCEPYKSSKIHNISQKIELRKSKTDFQLFGGISKKVNDLKHMVNHLHVRQTQQMTQLLNIKIGGGLDMDYVTPILKKCVSCHPTINLHVFF